MGGVKVRGLACRRHDTPRVVGARNIAELRHRRQEARRIYEARLAQIECGQVAPSLLIIEQVSSREIDEYDVETRAALVARELIGDGVNARPGEKVGAEINDAWFTY